MVLASADPRLFRSLHLYTAPLSSPVTFARIRVSDEERTVLLPCLVHDMFGQGLPVPLQNRVAPLPSTSCRADGAMTISGESVKK